MASIRLTCGHHQSAQGYLCKFALPSCHALPRGPIKQMRVVKRMWSQTAGKQIALCHVRGYDVPLPPGTFSSEV